MSETFQTPVGRIVWGNPAKSTIKKDQNTKQPIIRDGQQVQQWAFGLAIPKAEFNAQVKPYLDREAYSLYSNGTPPKFSWKYKDGDGIDPNGKLYSDREGYGGCFILTVATEAFAPPVYKFENNAYRQIAEEEIKCGDYVSVSLNIKANKPQNASHTPGLFINPNGVLFVAFGTEIVSSGQDPEEMFNTTNFNLPQGASMSPISSAPAGAPPYAGQPQQAPAPMPGIPPQYAPAAVPPGYVGQPQQVNQYTPPPAYDFVQNAGQPQQAPAPMPGIPPQYAPAAVPPGYVGQPPQAYQMPGMPPPRG